MEAIPWTIEFRQGNNNHYILYKEVSKFWTKDLWDMTRHVYMDEIKQFLTPIICLHICSCKFNHNASIVY